MIEGKGLDQAESEANAAGMELERALERLRDTLVNEVKPEVESYVKRRVTGVREEVTGVLEDYAGMAEDKGRKLVTSLREAAERELKAMDERPLLNWSIVLFAGAILGFALGKSQPAAKQLTDSRERVA